MKENESTGANAAKVSAYDDFLKKQELRKKWHDDDTLIIFVIAALVFVLHFLVVSFPRIQLAILKKTSITTTTEKVLREDLTFKTVNNVKPVEGVNALPIGSVLVEGKNPNPDVEDIVVNAQVIPFREIPVGTEVNVYIVCDVGVHPQSFFYFLVE